MNSYKFVFTVIFSLGWFFSSCAQQRNWTPEFEKLMSEAVEKDLFSGNVLVVQDGKILYQKAVGKADFEKNEATTADTRYEIASLTKLLTKITVLQLVEQKKIALNDPLNKYLDGFSAKGDKITVQHLLDHQAGFGQYYEVEGFEAESNSIKTIADFLPFIRREKLKFEVGTGSEYSNSGYVLLAAIVEKATGKKFDTVLKSQIFDPLSMSTAAFSVTKGKATNLATGYLTRELGDKKPNAERRFPSGGDGGAIMTASDFFKLDQSIFSDNKLLSDASKRMLFRQPNGKTDTWQPDKLQFAIGGGAPGISTVYGKLGDKKLSFIIFSNYDEGSADALLNGFLDIVRGKTPSIKAPLSQFLYQTAKNKGAAYFTENIAADLEKNGYELDDDMMLLFAGQALMKEKRTDEAIALYQFYTKKFPNIIVAWNELGEAYLLKNQKAEAKQCFEKVLEMRPQNPRAKKHLEALKN